MELFIDGLNEFVLQFNTHLEMYQRLKKHVNYYYYFFLYETVYTCVTLEYSKCLNPCDKVSHTLLFHFNPLSLSIFPPISFFNSVACITDSQNTHSTRFYCLGLALIRCWRSSVIERVTTLLEPQPK